jgi:hypothetical protein
VQCIIEVCIGGCGCDPQYMLPGLLLHKGPLLSKVSHIYKNMTSIIVVQVGQCGNQLGGALWDALAASTDNGALPSPFFCRDRTARCVLVDSEPKVVMGLHHAAPKRFHESSLVTGQCGRGNHWALGYYGVGAKRGSLDDDAPEIPMYKRDPSKAKQKAFLMRKDQRQEDAYLLQHALYAVHKESTRVDQGQLEAIVVVHGLAGGTGSGFTSRLVEKIRLHFTEPPTDKARRQAEDMEEEDGLYGALGERRRTSYIVSIAVAPQLQGENALQGLNTALTLRSLIQSVDAIILLRNDDVLNPTPHSMVPQCDTFRQCNDVFASWLMPVLHFGLGSRVIGELIEKVAPDSKYKFLSLVPIPQRNLIRYKRCAVLSREYRWQTSGSIGQQAEEAYGEMHLPSSSAMLDMTHSTVNLGRPPRSFVELCSALAPVKNTPVVRGVVQAGTAYSSLLVLNQTIELNKSLLFPLLRDAALKIQAQAFLTEFVAMGMTIDDMADAYRSVAHVLLYEGFN